MSGHKIVVITTNLRNLQNIQPAFEICAPFFFFEVIAFPLETDPTSGELSRFPQVEICNPLKTLKPKPDELGKLQNDLQSVLNQSGAKAVLLTDVQTSLAKYFYDISFKKGIPVIGTQHGIVQAWQKIAHLKAFDCLFLFSPAYRKQIRSSAIAFCALPRLDLILRARENQGKNQLLFFAQKVPLYPSLANFFNELKKNGISTIVRPHPQFGVRLSDDLQEADLPFKVESKPIAEQIISSDFTLSDHSTAMVESLWLNCKALLLPGSKASVLSNYPGELSTLTPQAFKKCLEDFDKSSISEILGQLVYSPEPVHRKIFLSAMWRFFWLQASKGRTCRSSWKKRFREFRIKKNMVLKNSRFTENSKRNVLHISISPLAGSPERLSNLISEESKSYNSLLAIHQIAYRDGRVFGGDVYFSPFGDQENLKKLVKQADVIHFHNESYFCLMNFLYPEIQDKAIVLQWHSGVDEMSAKTGLPADSIASWDGVRQIVVAQAQRDDYPKAIVVPNIPFLAKFESKTKLAKDRDELENLRKKAFGWARESWSKEWCLGKYEEIYALVIKEKGTESSRSTMPSL